jgi:hypothetical protein
VGFETDPPHAPTVAKGPATTAARENACESETPRFIVLFSSFERSPCARLESPAASHVLRRAARLRDALRAYRFAVHDILREAEQPDRGARG